MTDEELKRIEKIEKSLGQISATLEKTISNQERFANAMENILDYMEQHQLQGDYRPPRLDS